MIIFALIVLLGLSVMYVNQLSKNAKISELTQEETMGKESKQEASNSQKNIFKIFSSFCEQFAACPFREKSNNDRYNPNGQEATEPEKPRGQEVILYLFSGDTAEGILVAEDENQFTVEWDDQAIPFPKNEVRLIKRRQPDGSLLEQQVTRQIERVVEIEEEVPIEIESVSALPIDIKWDEPIIPYQSDSIVRVDGLSEDWRGVFPLATEVGDVGRGKRDGIDIKKIFSQCDEDALYFLLTVDPSIHDWYDEKKRSKSFFCGITIDARSEDERTEESERMYSIWLGLSREEQNGEDVLSVNYTLMKSRDGRRYIAVENGEQKSVSSERIAFHDDVIELFIDQSMLGLRDGDTCTIILEEDANTDTSKGKMILGCRIVDTNSYNDILEEALRNAEEVRKQKRTKVIVEREPMLIQAQGVDTIDTATYDSFAGEQPQRAETEVGTIESSVKKEKPFKGPQKMIALVILGIGIVLHIIGGIYLLVRMFQTSIWWGVGGIFLPIISLIYIFMHWDRAKEPFLIQLIASGCYLIVFLLAK